jgi:hypothetical protein
MNAQSQIIAMISKSMAQIHSFGSHHLDSKPGFMFKVGLSWLQWILILTVIGIDSAASVGIYNEIENLEFNGFNLPLNSFGLRAGNKNTKFGGKQCQPNLNSFRAVTHNHEDGSFQWLLTSTGRPFVYEGDFAAGCYIHLESSGTPAQNDSPALMQIIILHSVGFNAGAGSVSALSSDDTNPRGGAHIFSNGATNPVNQSSAKGDTSVLNNNVLIQQDIIPEVHLNTVRDYNIFDGDATNPWRKQQSVKGLRTLDLSLRFQCREGLSQRSPKDFVSNIYMSVRAFKLLATAFNFNVATGLKQEISSFYAAAVSTQDLFYESKVNFKYSDDFNVRYSSDLGVALMSAAPVLSIMTQISAASMLLIMAPMPAAPMLSLMAPMPAAQIPNPDQIAYWHSAPRHAFVAHYFCDHILAITIASSTPCQE